MDFTATWCGPCRHMAPIFAELSKKHVDLIFVKVDVDQLQVSVFVLPSLCMCGFYLSCARVSVAFVARPEIGSNRSVERAGRVPVRDIGPRVCFACSQPVFRVFVWCKGWRLCLGSMLVMKRYRRYMRICCFRLVDVGADVCLYSGCRKSLPSGMCKPCPHLSSSRIRSWCTRLWERTKMNSRRSPSSSQLPPTPTPRWTGPVDFMI